MTRRPAALVLALVLALPQAGRPAPGDEPAELQGLGLKDDPDALALYESMGRGRMTRARESAEAVLKRNPDSYAAHYVLGSVLHEAEGNLPLAYHHLLLARSLFEGRYGRRPREGDPWRWHLSILQELSSVTREMDRFEEALSIMDAHDAAYDPDEVAARAWPLLRLRRYDDARRHALAGITSSDGHEKQMGRTALCAIEAEMLKRQPAYDACLAALRAEPAATAGPHLFTNAAASALEILRMDEAERLMLEGTRHFDQGNAANPWLDLMTLYVNEGRASEAVGALRQMIAWRRAQPPFMDEQTGAETEFASALFLTVVGKGAEAARITSRVLGRPDRTGFTSAESSQMEAATALLDRAALRIASERAAEAASAESGWAFVKAWAQAQQLALQGWSSGRRGARLVSDERMLLATIRPYLPGGVSIPSWMVGDLVAVLGPGVMTAAVERARRAEDMPAAAPYFDAFAAEAALAQSRYAQAGVLAARARASLPRTEVLLQARVAAVGAQAALERGDALSAARQFADAWQLDPGVIRRLGLALPATFAAAPGAVPGKALSLLRSSPRLRDGASGFAVTVTSEGGGGRACLGGPSGETLACAAVTPRAGEDEVAVARRLVAAFHDEVFAARADLTQGDLQSLDGSTTVARDRAERKIQGVLDALQGDAPAPAPTR